MDEKDFQEMVKEKGFTEYRLDIQITARCGGEQPGWVSNIVESELIRLLPKNGIMVDKVSIGWPLEEVKR